MAKLRVLHVSMECVPFAKVGGMADVVGALPGALREIGVEGAVLLPYYPQVYAGDPGPEIATFDIGIGGYVHHVRIRNPEPYVFLVDLPAAFDRGDVYTDPWTGEGFHDSLFQCLALQQAARRAVGDGVLPADIVHCHDNHTGMLPTYLKDQGAPPSVFTIHNLGYQGIYGSDQFWLTGLDPRRFFGYAPFEFHGNFSLMKSALVMADKVTTVSPGYAEEILRPEEAYGLDGVLRSRGSDFVGILNGIDTATWNPADDPLLPAHYDADDKSGKAECKRVLQEMAGLDVSAASPVFGIVSRVTKQKGLDLLGPLLRWLVDAGGQLVMLGTGDHHTLELFRGAHGRWPNRVSLLERYDEEAAHRIYAGSDFFCMPSRFEPCGLTQMYAMRYGAVPIVTARGGLRDTVLPYVGHGSGGTGILATWADTHSLWGALDFALQMFGDGQAFHEAQDNGMRRDFSWTVSAHQYEGLYRSMLGR